MFRKTGVVLTALSCMTLGIVAVTVGAASGATSSVVTLEGNTGVTFTDNFNPFDSSSFAEQLSVRSLVNEPLFEFDTLKANTQYPWLATSYAWSNGGKTLTFQLRKGVNWSDGKPFTSADVAFTFDLLNRVPAANVYGVPKMSSNATTKGKYTVILHYATPQYLNITSIAGTALIVPQHVWAKIANPATAVVTKTVGTGPYTLSSYSSTLVKYKVNPHYWGGKPAPSGINVPAYSSNTSAATALADGQLTWAGNDIANVNKIFVDKNPKTNHIYFAPGSTVTLEFNVTGTGPLSDPAVRQAISAGIDRTALSVKGETGYEKPATSSGALILPNQASYLASSLTNDLSATSDPSKVASILTAAGYAKDSKGFYAKNGTEIQFSIEDPTAYSDYYADCQLISNELQAEGINATVDGVQASQWYTDSANGSFQSIIHWGNGGASPFVQYDNWLDYTLSAPIGTSANSDYGRYNNPSAQAALTTLENTNPANTSALKAAVTSLENLVSTQVPVAPLLYGADWDEYSTANFTGFVTAANPYADPSPGDPQLPLILMHLKKA
ncbi:MAG TPA: ABC transporter substrate-binding protein [Acidimicrobiales bacterium]|nr:ABC transporter substrate-binding protein [Acidimicrobiales bacterium]